MSAYQSIKVSLIDIPEGRLRDVDTAWAECLSGMFLEVGQKTPIDVVAKGKRFELAAGAHRLTAAKVIKWNEIEARVLAPKGEQAADDLRLHEILENLARKNFNSLERCEAFHDMKQIHEKLFPETKHGGNRGNQHTGGAKRQVAIFAFCQNAAETTGLSERSVRLAVQIFENLTPETRERLRGTCFANKQSDLKALSEIKPDQQGKVLDLITGDEPRAGSISEAVNLINGVKPEPEGARLLRTVSDSLVKLPKASRSAVFRQHKKEIIALAKKEGWIGV